MSDFKNNINQILAGNYDLSCQPLGFITFKPKINTIGNDGYIRVHFWHKDFEKFKQKPFFPIHTHNRGMYSTVLHGAIKNTNYITYPPTADRRLKKLDVYSVDYYDNLSRLRKNDYKLCLGFKQSECHYKKDYYSVKSGCFHSSELISDYAITYTKWGEQLENEILVLGGKNGNQEYSFDRRGHEIDKKYVDLFLDLLGKVEI